METIGKEIWLFSPIEGYEVSNQGQVRSIDRYRLCGGKMRHFKGQVLSPIRSKEGYYRVDLRYEGKQTQYYVHRLVLIVFVGPCPANMECCHNDGNRANNQLSNLRWDSSKNNHSDRTRHGTHAFGINSGRTRLTDKDVLEIRNRCKAGEHQVDVAKDYMISRRGVSHIVTKRTWSHLV